MEMILEVNVNMHAWIFKTTQHVNPCGPTISPITISQDKGHAIICNSLNAVYSNTDPLQFPNATLVLYVWITTDNADEKNTVLY